MNNADKFKQIFNLYVTELWAMSEKDFLAWLKAECDVLDTNVGDLISRQMAIDVLAKFVPYVIDDVSTESYTNGLTDAYNLICQLPSVQPETCEGCKHLGKWENEVEYGYSSPCTCCKRRVGDHYER